MSFTFVVTALGLPLAASALVHTRQEQQSIDFQPCPEFNTNITAINTLQGPPFDCATLSVPLDYTDPDSEPLELSLFRVNATEEPVLGTVLINFGGPGGTGAENLPIWADEARNNIGAQWNLLSWDPRGTGNTIPFRCNTTALLGVDVSPQSKRDLGALVSTNVTDVFLNGGWETAGALADFCSTAAGETGALIGTAFTARDMIQIVDGLGEDGLLRYYGWSYGTALGSYVAALFPERVERVVLDANTNPSAYAAGHYGEYVDNIDEAFAGFLETCFNVTDDCAVYTLLQPNTTQDMLDAINLVLTPFAQNATSSIEAYLTYAGLKTIFVDPLYFPTLWPSFAETLAGLLNGISAAPTTSDAPAPAIYGTAQNAVYGIRGSDATFIANSSDEYLAQVQFQATVSPGFSDVNYFALWPSAQWRMPARERYFGNFQVITKNPILYVNGEFDPVTPLADAMNASATFEGSVLLTHSGYGHGVFADPSQCVAGHVQAYFANGTLPEEGTRCEPDVTPVERWVAAVQEAEGNSTDTTSGGDGSGSGDETTEADASEGDASGDVSAATRQSAGVAIAFAVVIILASMASA